MIIGSSKMGNKPQQKEQLIKNARDPWHYVKIGNRAPEYVNAIVEIPRDSMTKYELDK